MTSAIGSQAALPQPRYTDALRAYAASASTLVERRLRDAAVAVQHRRRPRSDYVPRPAYWPDDKERRTNHRRAKAIEAAYETGRACDRPKDLTAKD